MSVPELKYLELEVGQLEENLFKLREEEETLK